MNPLDEALASIDWPPDMPDAERQTMLHEVIADLRDDIRRSPWWARPLVWLALWDFNRRHPA